MDGGGKSTELHHVGGFVGGFGKYKSTDPGPTDPGPTKPDKQGKEDPKDPATPGEENPSNPADPEEPVEVPVTPTNPPRYKTPSDNTGPIGNTGYTITEEGIIIDENGISLGQAQIDELIALGLIELGESDIPLGKTLAETLPKTGQSSRAIFYLLGAVIAMLGVLVGKKKIVKQ